MEADFKGKLIGKFGRSRFNLILFLFFSIFFLGLGILFFSKIPEIKNGANFDGDTASIYKAIYITLGLGASFLFIALVVKKPNVVFYLHENAIRTVGKYGERTDFYKDIEDVFDFLGDGFGIRASLQEPWIIGSKKNSRSGILCKKLIELHVKHRGQKLYEELKQGKTVVFRYISDKDAKSIGNIGIPLYRTIHKLNKFQSFNNIELTATTLKIGNKDIEVKEIQDIKSSFWDENIEIKDRNGEVFHKMSVAAIMSLDVFCMLLEQLQEV